MKRSTKLISLMLCALLALCALPFAAAGDGELPPENPFIDVKPDRWYTEAVLYCYGNRYMVGVSDTEFSLSGTVSRAMIVLIMAKLAGADLSLDEYDVSEFTDVPTGKWYSRAVEWAHLNNMASGTGNGAFSPNKSITRQELAVFLYRLAGFITGSDPEYDTSVIGDRRDIDSVASWAKGQMSWAIGSGVMHGTTPYDLSPLITLTRAQVAEIVFNMDKYIIESSKA